MKNWAALTSTCVPLPHSLRQAEFDDVRHKFAELGIKLGFNLFMMRIDNLFYRPVCHGIGEVQHSRFEGVHDGLID
jgi:hypothetical protein